MSENAVVVNQDNETVNSSSGSSVSFPVSESFLTQDSRQNSQSNIEFVSLMGCHQTRSALFCVGLVDRTVWRTGTIDWSSFMFNVSFLDKLSWIFHIRREARLAWNDDGSK